MNSPVIVSTYSIEPPPVAQDNPPSDGALSSYPGAFKPISKQDATAILGVSLRTVENWINQGILPNPGNLGGRRMWHPDTFFQALDKRLRTTASNHQSMSGDAESVSSSPPNHPRHPEKLPAAARARERAAARIEKMRSRSSGSSGMY